MLVLGLGLFEYHHRPPICLTSNLLPETPKWNRQVEIGGHENEVLKRAEAEDPQQDTGQKCEVFYYLGMAHHLGMNDAVDPDTTKVREYFEKCVSTREEDFMEYMLAGQMLEDR